MLMTRKVYNKLFNTATHHRDIISPLLVLLSNWSGLQWHRVVTLGLMIHRETWEMSHHTMGLRTTFTPVNSGPAEKETGWGWGWSRLLRKGRSTLILLNSLLIRPTILILLNMYWNQQLKQSENSDRIELHV